ncbi:MAG: phage tail tape measure protein [Ilumatobacteraceae bacterium]
MAAGTTVARINTIVTANTTQFTAAMGKAQTTAGKFAAAAGAAARAASGPLTLGLLGVGAAAVKAAVDFDDSMTKIESLVGIAGSEVDAMAESVRALSGETAQAPGALADAMFFIQSAGLRGAVAMETLEASAKAAAIGLGEVTEIADLATSALNAYGAENLSAVQATDVLTAAVREGKLEASELAGSMGRVLPIASAMGVRFDEVGAAFAALSRTGTNAAEAATQVRGILSSLLRPTKQAEEALEGMGLSSEGLRNQIKDEGLLATLQTLAEEFDGNAAASASVFGNIRALSGVMDLMGANVATTEQIFANMRDTTGTLDDAFAVVSDTAGFKFQQAMADLQETLIGIGEQVIPIVLQMLEGVQFLVGAFTDLPGPIQAAAAAMAALVVASGPIGQIAIAVGGLLYVFGEMAGNAREAKDRQEELTQEFIDADSPTHTMIGRMEELAAAIRDVGDAADETTDDVDTIVGSATALGLALGNDTLPLFDELEISMNDVAVVAESGTDAFQELQEVLKDTASADAMRRSVQDLTGAEREMADALIDAFDAGNLEIKQLDDMLDVVDETADAFDDDRKALEAQAEELVKSGDVVRILATEYDNAEAMVAGFQRQNLSNLEIMRRVDTLVGNHAESLNGYSIEAHRAGIEIDTLGGELAETSGPIDEVISGADEMARAMGLSADETFRMRDEFSQLMEAILGEGNALYEAEQVASELAEIVAQIGKKNAPDMAEAFVTGSNDVAGALDGMLANIEVFDDPAALAAVETMVTSLSAIGEAAGRGIDEIAELQLILAALDGADVEFNVRVLGELFGLDDFGIGRELRGFAGATGAIVRRPTTALIGEAGPEAVVPLSTAPGASPLPAGFGGGGTMNVTIQMPVGSDASDIIRTLDSYSRRNGNVPITTGG